MGKSLIYLPTILPSKPLLYWYPSSFNEKAAHALLWAGSLPWKKPSGLLQQASAQVFVMSYILG